MDEKKKIILSILGGLTLLFFVFTNFCRPLMVNISKHAKEYKELKAEIIVLDEISEDELVSMENKLDITASQLDEYLPSKGELKFVQQLTTSAEGLDIIFTDIAQKGPKLKEEYEELPVDVFLKSSFDNLLNYLLKIEKDSLLIGINALNIRKTNLQSPILDIRITFTGFNLLLKPMAMTKYMEKKYEPINVLQLEALFKPLSKSDNQDVFSRLEHRDIFVNAYDFREVESKNIDAAVVAPNSIADNFSLQGILNVDEKKAVLINGRVVKEGEVVDGAQIVAIQEYEVIIRYLSRDYILKIGAENAFTK